MLDDKVLYIVYNYLIEAPMINIIKLIKIYYFQILDKLKIHPASKYQVSATGGYQSVHIGISYHSSGLC